MEERRRGSAVGGLVLLVIGGLYLLGNIAGESYAALAMYTGPIVAIVLGAYFMYRMYGPDRKPGKVAFPWPLFMILGGGIALASMMGLWTYGISMGPLALIIVGAWLLVKRTH
jgi:hypothetical protein